jgi:hypothetical protein
MTPSFKQGFVQGAGRGAVIISPCMIVAGWFDHVVLTAFYVIMVITFLIGLAIVEGV